MIVYVNAVSGTYIFDGLNQCFIETIKIINKKCKVYAVKGIGESLADVPGIPASAGRHEKRRMSAILFAFIIFGIFFVNRKENVIILPFLVLLLSMSIPL